MKEEFVLETRHLVKTFPGVVAVNDVDFEVRPGEVHALLGENGAGKSTFCKVLSGVHQATSGEVFLKGKEANFHSPHDALVSGLSMVYQERNLIPFLTAAQNICLGTEGRRFGVMLDKKAVREAATEIRDRFGARINLDTQVRFLSPSDQQVVEILRALLHNPSVLLLDEPTSSLTQESVDMLYEIIHRVVRQGVGVIFISHKLEEVFKIADRVTIFRDGEKVLTKPASELDRNSCIRYMTNRDIDQLYPSVSSLPNMEPLLEVHNLSDGHKVHDVSFNVAAGEIVGFYGLVGAGRTELANLIYGISPVTAGKVMLEGKEINIGSPEDALKQGIFLVPENRAQHGLFDNFRLKENLSIAVIDRLRNVMGLINHKKETEVAKQIADNRDLSLVYTDIEQEIDSLSGGNKQKILIARWLARRDGARVIILDEPTQGIDIGVKHEIYKLLRNLAEQYHLAVIFISSELLEVLGMSNRLYVFKQGTIVKEFLREESPDQEEVLRHAF
jgi:ABC-type sugar transport system ATPase subunit